MPTLRRRKAKDQDKENTDAMVDADENSEACDAAGVELPPYSVSVVSL